MVSDRISLVIIEDEDAIREGISLFLNRKSLFNVLGSYGNGKDALKELPRLQPQIALVDLALPDLTGMEVIQKIKEMDPAIQCLVFSSMESEDWVFEALKKGADGYLIKTEGFERVASALEEIILRHGTPISPRIARRIVQEFQGSPDEPMETKPSLTKKETEILNYLSQGLTYKEIAEMLVLSPQTVSTHVKKIYKKLHASGKAEALFRQRDHH